MNWKGKKVLVTGAGGFIGSHLVDKLVTMGADVTAFVHYNSKNDWGMLEENYSDKDCKISVTMGDIADGFAVDDAVSGNDCVFHLAALIGIPYSYVAPESYVNTNIKGTLNVMQACRHHHVERVIHTSTSEAYGTAIYTPIDEKHPLQGQSPYSATKIGADKIAESYFCSFDLPVSTLRPFNTFGPRQSARAVIPTIISQALNSDKISLGSLSPVRDMNFVYDTVNGFIKMAESEKSVGMTINVGTGRGVTIGEIAEIILKKVNPEAEIICKDERVRPENSEVMQLICDNSLAGEVLGWKPEYTLEEGLDVTIEWIRKNIQSYKTSRYTI
ncbi:MAG: SDR family NAD(P)-dependent oxidoreductase [Methanomicrobiaceae archaeon]|nr:SDR family NAD(P)-dependent oxidoreductase [Methanomicrobiaceae archaeon]